MRDGRPGHHTGQALQDALGYLEREAAALDLGEVAGLLGRARLAVQVDLLTAARSEEELKVSSSVAG